MAHVAVGKSEVNLSGMDDVSFDHVDVLESVSVFEGERTGFNIFLAHRPE